MKVQTYNVVDMAKVMMRVSELTRENARLKRQVAESAATIADLERENARQLQQLADFESHYARQRTAAVTLPVQRTYL